MKKIVTGQADSLNNANVKYMNFYVFYFYIFIQLLKTAAKAIKCCKQDVSTRKKYSSAGS